MFKWLRGVPPKVGTKWYHRVEGKNPFNREDNTVEVLVISEGYVQYKGPYTSSRGYSCGTRPFRATYKEII